METVRSIFFIIILFLCSCASNTNDNVLEERINSSKLSEVKPLINNYITEKISTSISFESDTTTIINDQQITAIVNWCRKIKQDSTLRANAEGSMEDHYVVQLLGIITPEVPYQVVEKRVRNVQYYINNTLGIHLRGEVPVFDVLQSYEYSTKKQNTVVLGINQSYHQQIQPVVKVKHYCEDSILENKINSHQLLFSHDDATDYEVTGEQLRQIYKWINEIKQDSFLKEIEFEKELLFVIESTIDNSVSGELVEQHLTSTKQLVIDATGFSQYGIPRYKVLATPIKNDSSFNFTRFSIKKMRY